MYTVIILNKRSSDLLGNYKFLFKPFVDEGILGFCDWNESGTDIQSSVPDLYNIVRGKKDWRAIVVNTDSIYDYKDSPVPHKNNPFDYSALDHNPIPHESPIPLIRLTHMIGGYSCALTKEFEKAFEYEDMDGQLHRVRAEELSEEEISELNEQFELKSIYMEKKIPDEILESRDRLEERYQFSDTRPMEIQLVATRKRYLDNDRVRIAESWKTRLEMTSSAFWEKNKYPNNCRFLCYEITNTDNSMYHKELTEFWLSVLTLAINRVQASTLQAYRLYKLSIDVSKDQLASILNEHLNKMTSAYAFVKAQLQLRPEYSFDEDEELVTRQVVPVALEKNEGKDLFIAAEHVGLSRDCPEDEMQYWNSQVRQKQENFDKFLKAPRRAIAKSATYLKQKSESFLGDHYELDSFQVDDLTQILDDLEQQIITTDTKNVINREKFQEEIQAVNKKAKKEISYRMRKKVVIIAGIVAMLLCLCGFIPYLITAYDLDSEVFFSALLLSLGVMALSSIGGVIALLIQRGKLVGIMKEFNQIMRNAANGVRAGVEKFENYFSDICTYMKAQSIMEGIRERKANSMSKSGLLCAHKRALTNAIERDENWIMSYGITRVDEVIPNVTVYFKPEVLPRNNGLYYFVPDHEDTEIPINSTGDMVVAPYKFVEKLHVVREDIFDEVKAED